MTSSRTAAFTCVAAFLVLTTGRPIAAQRGGGRTGGPAAAAATFDPRNTDPMAGPVVSGAPFSADATTTVTQTLGDGTRIDQRTTARFYRDSSGRVRREQMIIGLNALNPAADAQTVITFDSVPGDPMAYQLDPLARTARRVPRTSPAGFNVATSARFWAIAGNPTPDWRLRTLEPVDAPINFQGLVIPQRGVPGDLRPTEDPLGTRQMEGLRATGRRTTTVIPTGRVGNDRPIQITHERWESPDLNVVLSSRFSDPRTAVIEYRLTNISRAEPRADLFTVPSDYTIVGPATPGLRGRGPGGDAAPGQRGGRSPQ